MNENIDWGIEKDLMADIRYEPNACKSYVLDLSLNCPHGCIYCVFSPLEKKAYKLMNSEYEEEVIPLKLDKFLEREKFPPKVYLSYSSDPLANPEITELTAKALKKLFAHDVFVLMITKGVFTEKILDVIKMRPDLMEIQVGITSADDSRNKIVEPNAPTYQERLNNLNKLVSILDSDSLVARIDPMLPQIDDTEKNIKQVVSDISDIGVKKAIFSYINLTKDMIEEWKQDEFTKKAAKELTEEVPTVTSKLSNKKFFSLPIEKKSDKLQKINKICKENNVEMVVCGCKELRLKEKDYDYFCAPSRLESAKFDFE